MGAGLDHSLLAKSSAILNVNADTIRPVVTYSQTACVVRQTLTKYQTTETMMGNKKQAQRSSHNINEYCTTH